MVGIKVTDTIAPSTRTPIERMVTAPAVLITTYGITPKTKIPQHPPDQMII